MRTMHLIDCGIICTWDQQHKSSLFVGLFRPSNFYGYIRMRTQLVAVHTHGNFTEHSLRYLDAGTMINTHLSHIMLTLI